MVRLTFFNNAQVVRLALEDGLEVLDVGVERLDLVFVEVCRGFCVLLDIEAGADVDDNSVRVGELALDVEGVCEGHEDVLLVCIGLRIVSIKGEGIVWFDRAGSLSVGRKIKGEEVGGDMSLLIQG